MKEATGDMTMTIVVIVGIIAVLTLASQVIWPLISGRIQEEVEGIDEPEIGYVEVLEDYNI